MKDQTIFAADERLRIRVVTDDDGRFNIEVMATHVGTRLNIAPPFPGDNDFSISLSGKVVDR